MSKSIFKCEFESTMESVGRVLNEALEVLIGKDWCPSDNTFCLRLCLEEALVNAAQHGNQNDSSRKIGIELVESGSDCLIRVSDEGKGYDEVLELE